MANLLSENILYTTIAIVDDDGKQAGTGFLVADTVPELNEHGQNIPTWRAPKTHAYLATARHVLGGNASAIGSTTSYDLRYSGTPADGFIARHKRFEVRSTPKNWAVHPNPEIDVAILDVTDWVRGICDGHFKFWPLSEMANAVNLAAVHCDAGDEVFVLGYPLTLRQGKTNLPLVRQGVLATSPRRRLQNPGDGKELRGFLVDGAIMPGSSGSPVVSTSKRFLPGDLEVTSNRPLILGVVAQEWGRGDLQRYNASYKNDEQIGSYANLGFVHPGATIIETIAELGYHGIRDSIRLDHDNNWAPETNIPEWALEFEGTLPDDVSMHRIMMRLHRDRIRAAGQPVLAHDYYDAIDIVGPVPPSQMNATTPNELFDRMGVAGTRENH
jgi:hypothetical protein